MTVYEHFRKEEHPFIDQILDWISTAEDEYRPKLSDFLDPRQQHIVTSVVGTGRNVSAAFFGGTEEGERKRALLYPEYVTPDEESFDIQAYEIEYPVKFVKLDHPQVLGTLMGLGLKREKFGDIIISGSRIQFVAAREIASYLEQQLTNIGKGRVTLLPIRPDQLLQVIESYTEETATVSSMRLDAVLAEAFRLSRSKIKPIVQAEKVKVNWRVTEDPAFQVVEGDMLSFRGKGRCLIKSVDGQTKKGKFKIVLEHIGR